ncbi:MAG: hypothetical protein KBC46_03510 [Ferrovibrio sp.]|nr:hypothetical protein [Ferrovibrio sp.]
MSNGALSWINHIATATLTTNDQALPGGAVTNLAVRRLMKAWRTTGSTAYFRADFGSVKPVQVLGLFGATYNAAATIRWRLDADTPGGSDELNVTAVADMAEGYGQTVRWLPTPVNARYLEIQITSSAPFAVGQAWTGPAWVPGRNFSWGAARQWVDTSRVTGDSEENVSGVVDIEQGVMLRERNFGFNWLSEADSWIADEMIRQTGRFGQILFLPNPTGTYLQREALLGRQTVIDAITDPAFDIHATAFRLREDK